MRPRIGRLLRRIADRIDYAGAPKSVGLSFTFESRRGAVLHGEFGVNRADSKGCPLYYLGGDDYNRAWTDADEPPLRVLWENLAAGRRPFVEDAR